MGKFFNAQGQVTQKLKSRIWPEFELVWDFMPVLLICNFDEDPIKNEGAIVSSTFFRCSRASNSELMVGSGRNSNSSETLWLLWLPASLTKIRSKMNAISCPKHFLYYNSMGKKVSCLSSLTASLKKKKQKKKNIKLKGAIVSSTFFFRYLRASNPMVGSGRNSNSRRRFYACPGYVQVWRRSVRSKINALSCPKHFLHYRSMGNFPMLKGK